MRRRARVTSIDALQELRAALIEFGEEVQRALISADADVSRATRLIGSELPSYWKQEIRKREQAVVKARIELEVAQTSNQKKSTVEERKKLARMKERLESGRARSEATKRWRRQLDREAMMYKGRVEPLSRFAQGTLPRASHALLQMMERLEEYITLQPGKADFGDDAEAAGMARSGSETGESMARSGAEHIAATLGDRIEELLPDDEQISAATDADMQALPGCAIPIEQRRRLGTLCPRGSLAAGSSILVAANVRTPGRLALHRDSPASEGDSGWRVLHLDESPPDAWLRVPVAKVLRSGSSFYDILRLRAGWTVIGSMPETEADSEVTTIEAVLDHAREERWVGEPGPEGDE